MDVINKSTFNDNRFVVFKNDKNFSLIEIKEKSIPHAFINKSNLRSIA